ncbi:FERM domain-containing protein 8 [Trichonephila clavipes]|nr:FERM domain-containing protein 8 [Trichonephila clavipes]
MENDLRYFDNRTLGRNRAVMRCGESGFEYPPHSFHYSPHTSTTGPLQINDDRGVPEWELPRSYPVGYRTVHPEYIPRHLIPSQPSQACYLTSNTSSEWHRENNPRVQKPVKKEDICVMLMNKVVLCVECENPSQATVQELMELILQDDQDLSLPTSARDVFSLWLVSPIDGRICKQSSNMLQRNSIGERSLGNWGPVGHLYILESLLADASHLRPEGIHLVKEIGLPMKEG